MKAISGAAWLFLCTASNLLGIAIIPWSQEPAIADDQPAPERAPRRLSAPTFYLVVDKARCWTDGIDVRGASNLPAGAVVDVHLEDFRDDGWTYFSGIVNATVDEDGFFEANIPLKQRANLPHNLIIAATFGTIYHHQPEPVLRIVGNHGENLDDLHNPQAHAVSGANTILNTIARAPCGSLAGR